MCILIYVYIICFTNFNTMRLHLSPPCVDSFPRWKLNIAILKLTPSIGLLPPSSGTIEPPAVKAPAPVPKVGHTPGQTPIKSPDVKKVKISDPTPPEHVPEVSMDSLPTQDFSSATPLATPRNLSPDFDDVATHGKAPKASVAIEVPSSK